MRVGYCDVPFTLYALPKVTERAYKALQTASDTGKGAGKLWEKSEEQLEAYRLVSCHLGYCDPWEIDEWRVNETFKKECHEVSGKWTEFLWKSFEDINEEYGGTIKAVFAIDHFFYED
jgi:hypothetical protein